MAQEPQWAGEGVFLSGSLFEPDVVEVVQGLTFDGRTIGRIFIHARMDELAAQVRRYFWVAGLLLLSTLGAALLLGLRLQQRVSRPILLLVAKTKEISEHRNYAVRVPATECDAEISALFHGSNAMLEQVERHERDLSDIRQQLERLVEDRTSTLDTLVREQRLILENLPLGVVHVINRRVVRANPRARRAERARFPCRGCRAAARPAV